MTAPAAIDHAHTRVHVFDPAALGSSRRAAGLTQEQVGELIGRHWVTVARYEGGVIDPPGSMLGILAGLYGVDVGAFYRTQ